MRRCHTRMRLPRRSGSYDSIDSASRRRTGIGRSEDGAKKKLKSWLRRGIIDVGDSATPVEALEKLNTGRFGGRSISARLRHFLRPPGLPTATHVRALSQSETGMTEEGAIGVWGVWRKKVGRWEGRREGLQWLLSWTPIWGNFLLEQLGRRLGDLCKGDGAASIARLGKASLI